MSDLRERLENKQRSLRPEPGGYERLLRRRHRREVRRRVEAGSLALIIALVGALAIVSAFHDASQSIPITPVNVHSLRAVWTGAVEGTPSDPTIADGMVYVSADRLYAFPLSCASGAAPCAPAWTADIGSASTSRPVVAEGVVLAVSTTGISAFDTGCGGPVCKPLWTAPSPGAKGLPSLDSHAPERYGEFSVPVVSDGSVFAAGGKGLYAFPLRCRNDGEECDPAWVGVGYGSDESPAVGERVIYVGSHGGLEAYPRTCLRSRCERLWLLGPSTPISVYPTVTAVGNDVYANNGRYQDGISPGSPEPTWLGKLDRSSTRDLQAATVGHVTVENGVAYMAASRVYAFPVDCPGGRVCDASWKGPRQYDRQIAQYRVWSDPVVADGLVFASTDRPYAFAVGCGSGGQVCTPLWVGPEGFASKPAVSDTAVAITYADGRVVVFEAAS
jgi:hypothetical protein